MSSRTAIKSRLVVSGPLAALALLCSTNVGAQTQQAVDDYLQAQGAQGYSIRQITEDYVVGAFPANDSFAVIFRQWPISIRPPQGLSQSNVFEVDVASLDVTPLTSPDDLQRFFLANLDSLGGDPQRAQDAGRAWMRMTEEFSQDNFFSFSDPSVTYSTTMDGSTVIGQIVVRDGGTGQIDAVLSFDANGQLVSVDDSRRVMAGTRPICQATKLLDPDPLVRRIVERDLLVIGHRAKEYLDMQRAKARPALRRAIDRIWERIVAEGR